MWCSRVVPLARRLEKKSEDQDRKIPRGIRGFHGIASGLGVNFVASDHVHGYSYLYVVKN